MAFDLGELDFDDIPEWSSKAQHILLVAILIVTCVLGFFFLVAPVKQNIVMAKQEEQMLRSQFRMKAEQVAALPDVDEQMIALKDFYDTLKMQLPEADELAILLAGINDTGQQYNLSFKQLHWQKGKQIGWLYQVPLRLELEGNYANIGQFAAALSRLPRIVALQDLNLNRVSDENHLKLSVLAHTYRFVELKGDES